MAKQGHFIIFAPIPAEKVQVCDATMPNSCTNAGNKIMLPAAVTIMDFIGDAPFSSKFLITKIK